MTDDVGMDAWAISMMGGVTASWFFVLGACLGSFLNVVIYRLPLRLSLSREPSRCPSCLTPIALRDNVPIFGWLRLRGRCRTCGWSIPIRYPLVEAIVATQFVTLLLCQVISGGWTLPGRTPEWYAGVVWTVWYAKYPHLLLTYGYHLLLLYFALGATLMARDGHAVPRRWLGFGALVAALGAAIDPRVHPLIAPAVDWYTALTLWQRGVGLLDVGLGAAVGAFGAIVVQRIAGTAEPRRLIPYGAVCGGFLGGWCGMTWGALWILTALIAVPWQRFRKTSVGESGFLCGLLALHVQLLAGRLLWQGLQRIWPTFGWMP